MANGGESIALSTTRSVEAIADKLRRPHTTMLRKAAQLGLRSTETALQSLFRPARGSIASVPRIYVSLLIYVSWGRIRELQRVPD
jgi:hypothetical protein